MKKEIEVPEGTRQVKEYMLSNVKVKVRLTTKSEKIKASAEMDFFAFKVKNFTIRQKDDGTLWVNPPSQPMSPPAKWIRLFWSEDQDFWSKLSMKILQEYKILTDNGKTWKEIEGIVTGEDIEY